MTTTLSLLRLRTKVSRKSKSIVIKGVVKFLMVKENVVLMRLLHSVEVTIMKLKEQIRELENTVEDKAAVSIACLFIAHTHLLILSQARAAEKESELAVMYQQQERCVHVSHDVVV